MILLIKHHYNFARFYLRKLITFLLKHRLLCNFYVLTSVNFTPINMLTFSFVFFFFSMSTGSSQGSTATLLQVVGKSPTLLTSAKRTLAQFNFGKIQLWMTTTLSCESASGGREKKRDFTGQFPSA